MTGNEMGGTGSGEAREENTRQTDRHGDGGDIYRRLSVVGRVETEITEECRNQGRMWQSTPKGMHQRIKVCKENKNG